jgi:PII-like signaling protein
MTPPVKMLQIFVDENDTRGTVPLYEAIVRRLRQLEVAGATVHIGGMGFGSHGKMHQKHLFGISDDRPVLITVIDSEATIRGILPEIRGMVTEGLVLLLDVEVIPPPEGE